MDSQPSLYERLGGHAAITGLVDRFYDHMDTLPEAQTIRAMHPDDLDGSRARLALFLMMWAGGPRAYLETRGHPRMRARHLPFAIGQAEAAAWMRCMTLALEEQVADGDLRAHLLDAFARIADHMRNQPE